MSVHLPSAATPPRSTPPAGPEGGAPPSRGAGARSAAALLATLAAVAALAAWGARPPAPRPADAPPESFSEARALPVLRQLARIGDRGIGTAGGDSAARFLAAALAAVPGVEVRVQDEAVASPYPFSPGATTWYRVQNVVARIPGREPGAVLFSTHYDSPPESVGAGDAAMMVAAVVEAVRALAAGGARPRHTLLFVLGDGEEDGLLGSAAFLRHPWARDVRAFVNLESAGPAGAPLLFQAGPGNAWLARAYARAVERPHGTALAQDLFQAGVVPSDTDFRVYRDAGGLRGLDLATVGDGYAYHTRLDRPERIPPGTVQQAGETLLALARALGNGPLPGDRGGASAVYYSVLGRAMVVYGAGTARLLAVLALVLAAGALVFALRRRVVTPRGVAAGAAAALAAWGAGGAAALLAAFVLGGLLGRPAAWYAHPWLGAAAFGSLAAAGATAAHALWARRARADAAERRTAGWAGGLALWSAVLLALAAAGAGAGYLALWWVVPAAAALAVAAAAPRRAGAAFLLALAPGALLTLETGALLVGFFVPLTGRMSDSAPQDALIAALVAAPVLAVATLALPAAQRAGRLGAAAAVLGAVGMIAIAALALAAPYTPERPRRVALAQREEPGAAARLTVSGGDAGDLGPLLRGVPLPLRPAEDGGRVYEAEVAPAPVPFPAAGAASSALDPARGTRTVRLRVAGGGYRRMVLSVPRERLAGWSLTPALPALPAGLESYNARIIPGAGRPWEATLEVRGAAPVEVRLSAVHEPAAAGAAPEVERRLPAWAVASSRLVRTTVLRL